MEKYKEIKAYINSKIKEDFLEEILEPLSSERSVASAMSGIDLTSQQEDELADALRFVGVPLSNRLVVAETRFALRTIFSRAMQIR